MFGFFLVVVVIVVAVIAYQSHQSNQRNHAYARVAARLGGTVRDGGLFGRPSIHFHYRGARGMIDVYSTGGKHKTYYTQMHLDWPDARFRCEIYPEGFFQRIGMLLGFEDIKIGNRYFDDAYHISGSSADDIRRLLTLPVQQSIDALRRQTANNDIYVAIGGGRLLIKKRGYLRDYDTLIQFVTRSFELYELAQGTGAEGIEFVESAGPVEQATSFTIDEAICQICGEQVTQAPVFCSSCKTPHHEDCWSYYGACSTYGCGQTKFRRAKRKVKVTEGRKG